MRRRALSPDRRADRRQHLPLPNVPEGKRKSVHGLRRRADCGLRRHQRRNRNLLEFGHRQARLLRAMRHTSDLSRAWAATTSASPSAALMIPARSSLRRSLASNRGSAGLIVPWAFPRFARNNGWQRTRSRPFTTISIRITRPDEASRPASRMERHDDRSHHLRPRANAARTRQTGRLAAHRFNPPFGGDGFEGDQGSQPS